MKYFSILFTIALLTNATLTAQTSIAFGTDTTFEVSTWNIEHFPKNDQATVDYVINLVEMMDIDMLALQEIEDQTAFNQVVDGLPGYGGFYAAYEYSGMAYLYKTEVLTVTNTYKILTGYSRELPRAPFVAEITLNGEEYFVINNHYKCCGDGSMDPNDDWDEETRRLDASVLLKNYIDTYLSDKKVIVLGDLNDELTDNTEDNVFAPFLNDNENFMFADMHIAQAPAADWSYPSWPSHLDHILITNELVAELTHEDYGASIIKPDAVISGGWSTYDNNVSDHRPVAIKLPMPKAPNGLGSYTKSALTVYPNPANSIINIAHIEPIQQVQIMDGSGAIVLKVNANNKLDLTIETHDLINGMYIVNTLTKTGLNYNQKVLIR